MDNHSVSCGGGCGNCGNCGGCGTLELTQAELDLLRLFAQIPFLPVARRQDSGDPVFLEDSLGTPEVLGTAVAALFQKRLIQVDYDLPLQNFDYGAYALYVHWGSMALTSRGQDVVEQMEIQGIET